MIHHHFVHTHSVTCIVAFCGLLLILASCGSTPSTHATAIVATPTPNIPVRSTALLTYTGHSDGVIGLQWSSDSKQIVTCSDDDSVQMWDAATGKQRWKYSPFLTTSYIFDVALSPDGRRVAAAGSKSLVWILDATTGYLITTFNEQAGFILGVAWSPDSKRLAIGNDDRTVDIKDVTSGKTVVTYSGHTGSVARIAWSPDGTRIASASDDGTVQIWNAKTGQHILTYSGNMNPVFSVAWSPDGTRIVSGTGAAGNNPPVVIGNSVKEWDATTGKTLLTYTENTGSVYAVTWSPDGKSIASGGDDAGVRVWNAITGRTTVVYERHKDIVWKIAWSPDGKEIASTSQDGTTKIWQGL
jgi:WD40 repeat protein